MFRKRLRDFWNLMLRNKVLFPAVGILFLLYFTAVFAGFFSPYHYATADRSKSYHPPTPIYVTDDSGLTWPYVRSYQYDFNENQKRVYEPVEGARHPVQFFVEGDSYQLAGLMETDVHLFGVGEGHRIYLMGADSRGRDLFSRILYGGRISLSIGLVGVSIALFFGLLIGGISGYCGGWVDSIIQRLIEMIMIVPGLFLLLALRSAFPPDWSSIKVYMFIVVIMSFIGWAGMARVVRGMALSIREKEFVSAARACGVPGPWIIVKHIIPNTASYFIVAATVSIPGYILGESALSLLGLGIQDPHASWGNLLQNAMSVSQIQFHPWILIPGVFIFLAVMCFNLVGDALRDFLDPEQEVHRPL
jgi:peptide/nickel transport system permease protein